MHPPPRIPGYHLLQRLGGGPLTTVYEARDEEDGAPCAVKVLRGDWADQATAVKLLQREARAGLAVRHPHLVRITNAHVLQEPHFLVMELLRGESLRRRLQREYCLAVPDVLWVLRQAAEDPGVREIILDVDSPGGEVAGTEELAAVVAEARTRKPVTAIVNALAGSAAYWIASAATRIVSTPSGLTGSIGVLATHVDLSELERKAGIRVTEIVAPTGKADGSEHRPLTETGRAAIAANVGA